MVNWVKQVAIDLSCEDIQICYSRITQIINFDSINFPLKIFCKPFRNCLLIIKLIQNHHVRGLVYLHCKASGDVIFNLGWLSHNVGVNISWTKRSKLYLWFKTPIHPRWRRTALWELKIISCFFSSGREPVCEVQ